MNPPIYAQINIKSYGKLGDFPKHLQRAEEKRAMVRQEWLSGAIGSPQEDCPCSRCCFHRRLNNLRIWQVPMA